MAAITSGRVFEAVTNYFGPKVRVTHVDTYPDPKVPGTFALRAYLDESRMGDHVDFLVVQVPLNVVTCDDLEECDYATWPPVSGHVRIV